MPRVGFFFKTRSLLKTNLIVQLYLAYSLVVFTFWWSWEAPVFVSVLC